MKRVVLLFGGRSPEHEVSIMSAKNVYAAIDKGAYTVILVYVDKHGGFHRVSDLDSLDTNDAFDHSLWSQVDVVFPVMHGPYCEDGSMQGFLDTMGVRYVGPHVLGSALGMDKDIQKQLLRHNNILVTDWIAVRKHTYQHPETFSRIAETIEKDFSYPVFVKPANMGSSVGVSKVHNYGELKMSLDKAFTYDDKVLIEKAVQGREIECAVLGNAPELAVSDVGGVVSQGAHEFYDYDAKYMDALGSIVSVPAPDISPEMRAYIQTIVRDVFTILECRGLSRVDCFLTSTGSVLVNEINTMPGFTNVSMYPKLMEHVGIGYTELISRLIELA